MIMPRPISPLAPLAVISLRPLAPAPRTPDAFPAAPRSWFDTVQEELLGDDDLNRSGDERGYVGGPTGFAD